MDYPRLRAVGLCVAIGIVEGSCKCVVAGRLKHGGMPWNINGANALRCPILRNRLDDH